MRASKDYLEYISKLSPEEKAYVKQFYMEYYHGPKKENQKIIPDGEIKKEAHRNHNSEDLMNKVEVSSLDLDKQEFMEDACDAWDYVNEYKVNGFKSALDMIIEQTESDIYDPKQNVKNTLVKFLMKYADLRKMDNKRRKYK